MAAAAAALAAAAAPSLPTSASAGRGAWSRAQLDLHLCRQVALCGVLGGCNPACLAAASSSLLSRGSSKRVGFAS